MPWDVADGSNREWKRERFWEIKRIAFEAISLVNVDICSHRESYRKDLVFSIFLQGSFDQIITASKLRADGHSTTFMLVRKSTKSYVVCAVHTWSWEHEGRMNVADPVFCTVCLHWPTQSVQGKQQTGKSRLDEGKLCKAKYLLCIFCISMLM